MFELFSLITAFIGSSLAAAWDLKTTEIPDEIPYIMVMVALFLFGVQSFITWSYWPILLSVVTGLGLLGFGFMMYYLGQWGGGDAKILSAIGFLLPELKEFVPTLLFPFPVSYLFNVFLIGAAYLLIYAFALALIKRKVIFKFVKDIKASSKVIVFGSIVLFVLFFLLNWFLVNYFQLGFSLSFILTNSILPLIATMGLFILWKFAKTVENVGFKKRISISKLRIGDVLVTNRLWEGITKKELKKIKRSKRKFVWIKSGVRFAPSFVFALIFTLYFGDGLLLFMRFLI